MADNAQFSMLPRSFYAKGSAVLLIFLLSVMLLRYGQPLWVPLIAAGMLSLVVLPIVRRLESWRFSRTLAALAGVLWVFGILALIFGLLWWQLRAFWLESDQFTGLFRDNSKLLEQYVAPEVGLPLSRSEEWIQQQKMRLLGMGANLLLDFFGTAEMAVSRLILVPVFMFFLLIYREKFPVFIAQWQPQRTEITLQVAEKISGLARNYVRSLLAVTGLVWLMSSLGFAAIGLRFPVLVGLVVALLNIIPFLGFVIGVAFPVLVASVQNQSPGLAAAAFGVCIAVHLLDAGFLTPRIRSSSIVLNPLVSIMALVGGALLWGLPGVILAVLLAGVLKVVFDEIAALRPFGYLMGDEQEYGPDPAAHKLVLPDK